MKNRGALVEGRLPMTFASACVTAAYMSENKAPAAQLSCAGAVRLVPALTEDDRECPAPPWALPATRRGRAAHPILALHPSRGLFQCILEAADCLAFVLGGRPGRWFRATFQRFSEATRHVALLLTCDWGCCGLVLH